MKETAFILLLLALFAILWFAFGVRAQDRTFANPTYTNTPAHMIPDHAEKATFGGGCFWCVEAVFQRVRGVYSVVSGYAGGHVTNPTYRQVITGTTGHAEVIQVIFDPNEVRYEELLEIFFRTHDPTTLNRQGNDIGPQYRSIVLYDNEAQRASAESVKASLDTAEIWSNPIVTEIVPLEAFYEAEEYHQNYFNRNPEQAYCQVVIVPKLRKFERLFDERFGR